MTNIKTASEAVLFFIVQKHSYLKKHTEKRFEVCLRQVKFAMQVKFAYASDVRYLEYHFLIAILYKTLIETLAVTIEKNCRKMQIRHTIILKMPL